MGLYLLGLTDIVLTDIAPVMSALERNKPVLGRSLKISQLYWEKVYQIDALRTKFDVVIAADVVYIEDSAMSLVWAMERLVKDEVVGGVVILGYQVRSPEADKVFWERVEVGFRVEKVNHEDSHPEYAFEETDVCLLWKKVKVL